MTAARIEFPDDLRARAATLLDAARAGALKITVAESCTGGLLAALLTDIAGSSDVVERGFVTYSNDAKTELLGVPQELIARRGAVSGEVAAAMASGALARSNADVAVAITGVAGPGGGAAAKPVGLVWFGAVRRGAEPRTLDRRFGDIGRNEVRTASLGVALGLLGELVGQINLSS